MEITDKSIVEEFGQYFMESQKISEIGRIKTLCSGEILIQEKRRVKNLRKLHDLQRIKKEKIIYDQEEIIWEKEKFNWMDNSDLEEYVYWLKKYIKWKKRYINFLILVKNYNPADYNTVNYLKQLKKEINSDKKELHQLLGK